jgi:hypothetical protein
MKQFEAMSEFMRAMRSAALGFILAVTVFAPAAADEPCPAASQSYDDVVTAISLAPNCARAFEVMNACLFTASGDVGLAKAVEDKCEPAFLARLSPSRRRAYAAASARCSSKYAGQQGTMYVSFAATCQARLAVDYARKFGAP